MAKSQDTTAQSSAKSYRAIHRWARIAPRKARLIADMMRGLPVNDAVNALEGHPKRAASLFQKVLKSAVANALHEGKVRVEELYVKEAVVGAGPTLKRWLPRAQGRATPILKRTSHVTVTVATKESL